MPVGNKFSGQIVRQSVDCWALIGTSSDHIFIVPVGAELERFRNLAVGVLVVDTSEFCSIYF